MSDVNGARLETAEPRMTPAVQKPFTVRFLVSHNGPSSVMRLTAEYGSIFVRQGIPVKVAFPALDWWDYKLFNIARLRGRKRWSWTVRLMLEAVLKITFKRTWCGFDCYGADPRIQSTRFWFAPSAADWTQDEITVVNPPYLIPHLLRTLPYEGISMVSPIYMNLEKALASRSPETAAWWRHTIARDRLIGVVRYTVSQTARCAAERLNIPIRKVVYNGTVDTRYFHLGPPRAEGAPLTVTLYCDPNPQKGQTEGVEAVQAVKRHCPDIRLCSIGNVLPKFSRIFDHHYGYLLKESLARAMQESDIFVYPSLYDGFPAPPLQAMACGAAVVTTNVEGMDECAEHEVNALVCAPGNPQAMQQCIERLIRDRSLREQLQSNGPSLAARFTVERGAAELLKFLQEVYEGRPENVEVGVPHESV